jgi:methylenetetrahydrofolate reductase (NADPH)
VATQRGVAARILAAAAGEAPPTISFELYPPRTEATRAALPPILRRLATARPDFFSVTYGASGSTRHVSRDVVNWLLANTEADVVAHLTCVGNPRSALRTVVEPMLDDGVRDFLALRGDPPAGVPDWQPHPDALRYASDLVALLRDLERDVPLSIGVAATPSAPWRVPYVRAEGDRDAGDDIQALLAKEAAGAQYAISQVFFEPGVYVRYVEAARAAGVTIPVLPGIMPLTDPERLRRLERLSGVAVPAAILERLDHVDEAVRRTIGTAMSVELVTQVLEAGAPGLHIYTFNQHGPALALLDGLGLDGH